MKCPDPFLFLAAIFGQKSNLAVARTVHFSQKMASCTILLLQTRVPEESDLSLSLSPLGLLGHEREQMIIAAQRRRSGQGC
jgi:hypothetical protein